eukprot:gnl/TRDRNA2_/TRDRNA2_160975_c0_seq1.p1 gnl/TRDRNA2_/TRDRNA2_160975_c0~~gnl/TRDRNA2_/TRDRNA2_160975_c0_seq1.p1  ORF type:complete len:182 (-),score=23.93 gnl/TRDRNA2_/TRDRNA2_160975_c0_seq1:57-530(-)
MTAIDTEYNIQRVVENEGVSKLLVPMYYLPFLQRAMAQLQRICGVELCGAKAWFGELLVTLRGPNEARCKAAEKVLRLVHQDQSPFVCWLRFLVPVVKLSVLIGKDARTLRAINDKTEVRLVVGREPVEGEHVAEAEGHIDNIVAMAKEVIAIVDPR